MGSIPFFKLKRREERRGEERRDERREDERIGESLETILQYRANGKWRTGKGINFITQSILSGHFRCFLLSKWQALRIWWSFCGGTALYTDSAVLYCTVYWSVLYCTVLYCTVLCSAFKISCFSSL
jgi:hypothetical protein